MFLKCAICSEYTELVFDADPMQDHVAVRAVGRLAAGRFNSGRWNWFISPNNPAVVEIYCPACSAGRLVKL